MGIRAEAKRLIGSIDRLESAVESRYKAIDELVRPILRAEGKTQFGELKEVYISSGGLSVKYVHYFRGEDYVERYTLSPLLLDIGDPVAEATRIATRERVEKDVAAINAKRKEFERLKAELGES